MDTKDVGLHKLRYVKVILGNGFDLYCGLHTSYLDFFHQREDLYKTILAEAEQTNAYFRDNYISKKKWPCVSDQPPTLTQHNAWDVFFALSFTDDSNRMWCDIETEISRSLDSPGETIGKDRPNWDLVYQFLQENKNFLGVYSNCFILANFIKKKKPNLFVSKQDFYVFLLDELKEFEGRFARFITRQHVVFNGFEAQFNNDYVTRAHRLLKTLCKLKEITSIDCFNYGFTPEPVFYNKCNFVNGDCANPIFGVDSKFNPDESEYVFTKTNRRIEWEMNRTTLSHHPDFENAIVFGHSLSENDYSYFFPVLDQLEMTNFASKKKFVIAYCVYNPEKKTEIKSELRHRIYALFVAYAKYKGQSNGPARLLDSLTTQGRVVTVSISPCQEPPPFDEDKIDFWPPDPRGRSVEEKWGAYAAWAKRMYPLSAAAIHGDVT